MQHINRQYLLRSTTAALAFAMSVFMVTPAHAGNDTSSLESVFANPPSEYNPHCYVERMNGNLTREGITLDLEAMKRVGISGFHMFDIRQGRIPKGEVQYATPAWKDLLKHTFSEAQRLGLEAYINNCAGWSGSGGPWMTSDQAMYRVVWEEKELDGPVQGPITLAQPEAAYDFYRDIAVLAVRLPNTEAIRKANRALSSAVITSPGTKISTPEKLSDHNDKTGILFSPPKEGEPVFIDIKYPAAMKINSLHLLPNQGRRVSSRGKLQYSQDGIKYQDICEFVLQNHNKHENSSHTYRFTEKEGRFFRLSIEGTDVELRELRLDHRPVINRWEEKAGFTIIPKHGGGFTEYANVFEDINLSSQNQQIGHSADSDQQIPVEDVIDVTKHMNGEGTLDWKVPEGRWLLLRVGYRPTGAKNEPSPDLGKGLACDKLDPEAARSYMEGFLKNIFDSEEDLKAAKIAGILFDSWEVGTQNWTHQLRDEFKKRRGYDLLPYLPVIAGGRIIGNTEISERFLWDFRRTIADLIAEAYYGTMNKICTDLGLKMYAEPSGRQQFMYDPVLFQSQAGVPMGEFWTSLAEPRPDCKAAASAAHIYGKRLVGAEAFTAHPQHGKWLNHPFKLKVLGDRAFANGVNQFQFHRYAQQPWTDRLPGMTMGKWGFHFERTLTWWEQSTAWIQYLSRCQYLLQQGSPGADVCYLTDGGAPSYVRRQNELIPPLPKGFDYDGCDEAALVNLMEVEDGDIVTPGGARYRVLVLPPKRSIRPDVLAKLAQLVEDGATIVGPKPLFSPSLTDYPQCDEEVKRLSDLLWGNCDGEKVIMNRYGKGRVYWTESLAPVFDDIDLQPDVAFYGDNQDVDVRWIHRRWGDKDIYFLANSHNRFEDLQARFRVSGKTPRIFDPVTGKVTSPLVYDERDGRVTLSLRFNPAGSVFIIFSPSSDVDKTTAIHSISRDKVILQTSRPNPSFVEVDTYTKHSSSTHVVQENLGDEKLLPDYDVFKDDELHDKQIYNSEEYYPTCEAYTKEGQLYLAAWKPGRYDLELGNGNDVSLAVTDIPRRLGVEAPWKVDFLGDWGPKQDVMFEALNSWSENKDPNIQFFSGTAEYKKKFKLSPDRINDGMRSFLDLGRVEVIAEVRLNGHDLGILWKPPYRVEITDFAQVGENELQVRVTNLWPNRLIGDENQKDKAKRFTYSTKKFYQADSPLLDSGLLGPVNVCSVAQKEIPDK